MQKISLPDHLSRTKKSQTMGGSWTSICLVPVACAILCGVVNGRQPTKLPTPDGNLNIYALPIGQGDCTIIQCPANSDVQHYTGLNYNQQGRLKRSRSNDQLQTLRPAKRQKPSSSMFIRRSPPPTLLTVVDMGAVGRKYMSEENLSSFLGDQKRYIEVVTISHPDADHYNYIPSVLPISTLSALKGVYIGCTKNQYRGDEYDESTMRGWLSAAENSGKLTFGDGNKCTSSPRCPEIEICGGVATLRMLGANMGDTECCSQYRNSNSLVLRLEYGNFKLLLPGDFQDISKGSNSGVQWDLINAWANSGGIQADFYKVAHHGAYQGGSSSTTKANKDHFLQAVRPKYAFSSSAAPPNSYSHPHCGLYDRLRHLRSIARGRSLRNPQTHYTCGTGRGTAETRNNNFGIYSTSPQSDQPVIIHIATDGTTSSIKPIAYCST